MTRKTAQDWAEAASERVRDAEVLLEHRADSVGTIYMAGYVIELNLKSLWEALGREPPRTHDLRKLWKGTGFRLADLGDRSGAKAFFLVDWNTSLRYEAQMTPRFSADELLAAAKRVAGQIHRQRRRVLQRRPT